jgi:hypothetical protein
LRIGLVATNLGGAALDDLTLVTSLGPAFLSRQSYEDAIASGPSTLVSSQTDRVQGRFDAAATRTFQVQVDMSITPGVEQDDSKVYPVLIELRSDGATVGQVSTFAIHLVRTPEAPMHFSWWFEVSQEHAFGPDGTMENPTLEAALAPGGALEAQVAALGSLVAAGTTPVDVVVRPSLVEDARAMAEGYRRADGTDVAAGTGGAAAAENFLDRMRSLAKDGEVQTIALPLDAPSIPALLASGLDDDLAQHEDEGRAILREALGIEPASGIARPPGGAMDDRTVAHYATAGATTLLADADAVARELVGGLSPAPTAAVSSLSGEPIDLVLPDPGLQSLMTRVDVLADPVRAAQVITGELAVIWKEQPVPEPPTVRGIALAPPPGLPPTIWTSLLGRLAAAPFLLPVHARDLVEEVVPAGAPAVLASPSAETFADDYVQRIVASHRDVEAYASMLEDPAEAAAPLHRQLLRAESRTYLGAGEPAGIAWIESVEATTAAAFESTTPQVQQVFTFTSREGTIPLRMGDPGDTPLQVVIVMRSSRFDFPEGDEQHVLLERPNQLVEFDVVARASGQNPIAVTVSTPTGIQISSQTIVVRTTEVSSVALIITAGAGLGLLALYASRRRRIR